MIFVNRPKLLVIKNYAADAEFLKQKVKDRNKVIFASLFRFFLSQRLCVSAVKNFYFFAISFLLF